MGDEKKMKSSGETQGYKKLKVYGLSHDLAVRVHKMTVKLPKFEIMEEGSQIRRSSKSVSSNIVEGYALRRYKQEYIHYLSRALASSLETVEHLDFLFETESQYGFGRGSDRRCPAHRRDIAPAVFDPLGRCRVEAREATGFQDHRVNYHAVLTDGQGQAHATLLA